VKIFRKINQLQYYYGSCGTIW